MNTVEQYKNELDQHGKLYSIPAESGIYKIYMPSDFEIVISSGTDAVNTYKGRSLLYPTEKLEDKWSVIQKADKEGILYIGKADDLRKRITELIEYGYGKPVPHRGGRAVWQLENNKKLLIEMILCEKPREKERQMLIEYRERYGVYPFANWRK